MTTPRLTHREQIWLCRRWLRIFAEPRITVNRRRTSYGLKHCVESWSGRYVSHDAFKEAARFEGYTAIPVRRWGSCAVFFNFSTYAAGKVAA